MKTLGICIGITAGLALLLMALMRSSEATFNRTVDKEIRRLFAAGAQQPWSEAAITEGDLAGLPEPAQRYLRHSGIVGRPPVRYARIHQRARFRMAADRPWMPTTAVEYYAVDAPGFVWQATARMKGAPIHVRDYFLAGVGGVTVRPLSLFKIEYEAGPEINQGAMVRYLNEMMWFPSAFLGPGVRWEPVDDGSARVLLTVGELEATAVMSFDDAGRLTNFHAPRYWENNGAFVLKDWSTPITRYGEFDGLQLPAAGHAVWHLDDGDFTYIEDLELLDIEYGVPATFE